MSIYRGICNVKPKKVITANDQIELCHVARSVFVKLPTEVFSPFTYLLANLNEIKQERK
jgi:hypothetical protein